MSKSDLPEVNQDNDLYAVLKGRPCKIALHSIFNKDENHSTITLYGVDVFTGININEDWELVKRIDTLTVKKEYFSLIGVDDDGYLSLIDPDGNVRDDLKAELATLDKWNALLHQDNPQALVISALNEEKVLLPGEDAINTSA